MMRILAYLHHACDAVEQNVKEKLSACVYGYRYNDIFIRHTGNRRAPALKNPQLVTETRLKNQGKKGPIPIFELFLFIVRLFIYLFGIPVPVLLFYN